MSHLITNLRLDLVDNEAGILVDEVVHCARHVRSTPVKEVLHLHVDRRDVKVNIGAFDAQLLVARGTHGFDGCRPHTGHSI